MNEYIAMSAVTVMEDHLQANIAGTGPKGKRGTGPKRKKYSYDIPSSAERLLRLRTMAGFPSAAQAAAALGVNVVTYQHHENGRRPISLNFAEIYADFYRVSPGYILYGDQLPQSSGVPIVGIVGPKGIVHMLAEDERHQLVQPPPGDLDTLLSPMAVAGADLYPSLHDGDTIWFDDELLRARINPAKVNGRDCVVALMDGTIVVRRVTMLDNTGHRVTLSTYSEAIPPITCSIRSAAPIKWVEHRD